MKKSKTVVIFALFTATALIGFSAVSIAGKMAQKDDMVTAEQMKQETKEAIQAIKKYSIKQKDKAVGEVEVLLEKMDVRIDRMQRQIDDSWDKMDQASRQKARESLHALRSMRNNISEWYGGLKHSSANAWDQVKEGFVEGYEKLSKAFVKAEREFRSSNGNEKSDGMK